LITINIRKISGENWRGGEEKGRGGDPEKRRLFLNWGC